MQKALYLKKRITRCKDCGIFFLCDVRNCRRKDLRCPFGCRKSHRTKSSARRSAAYYATQVGKDKKREQNAQRNRQNNNHLNAEESINTKAFISVVSHTITKEHLSYIQELLVQIEERIVSLKEIQVLLINKWRQHSMDNNQKKVIISEVGEINILRE